MKEVIVFFIIGFAIPIIAGWLWTKKRNKKDKVSLAIRVCLISCVMITCNSLLINANYRKPIIIKVQEEQLVISKLVPKENLVSKIYGLKPKYFVTEYLSNEEYKNEQVNKK